MDLRVIFVHLHRLYGFHGVVSASTVATLVTLPFLNPNFCTEPGPFSTWWLRARPFLWCDKIGRFFFFVTNFRLESAKLDAVLKHRAKNMWLGRLKKFLSAFFCSSCIRRTRWMQTRSANFQCHRRCPASNIQRPGTLPQQIWQIWKDWRFRFQEATI